ncbi:G-type lectin S-receptor-like serine/threonine-protein kinase At1g11303 [Aegilops tauschii subsp. strangulata]|uniref:non-specific serine/threonine protein kinase n=1 Tax=Aegilops tauschii TaxID=37682 RepID=R7W3B4_AEGTA|nr:G-type lectin S-receptor-like serine/threonine-protein kinase At1g61550 [Triticum aestivum]
MALVPSRTLVSDQGAFALGFFSPSNATGKMYVGIWFNDIPQRNRTVVWVANRDEPITDASSAMLAVADDSGLVLSETDGRRELWKANTATLWQSFENPSDAILAGMPLRTSHRTRPPSRGVSPLMYLTISTGADGETYSTFGLSDGSSKVWYKAEYSGEVAFLRWNASSSEWTPISRSPAYKCNTYGYCGAYGYCDNTDAIPTCRCLDGFGPSDEAEWAGGNFSRGCRRKEALRCGGGDGFLTLPAMKAPDRFLRLWNKSFDDCAAECSSSCSCVAYAYASWLEN